MNKDLSEFINKLILEKRMTDKQIFLTEEQVDAVLLAINSHIYRRSGGDVREYVDARYSEHDEAFRNLKIGEIQNRFNALNRVREKLTT